MLGIFTISRNDIHDYFKCPQILAIKTYENLSKIKPKPKFTRGVNNEIGKIGEIATQHTFSKNDALLDHPISQEINTNRKHRFVENDMVLDQSIGQEININCEIPSTKTDWKRHGVQLDQIMKDTIKETQKGLIKIKKHLYDQYGEMQIVGHGESHNGLLPNTIRPDFIAIIKDRKKPILVEVKNTKKINHDADSFQASFYNTVGRKFGITIMETMAHNNKTIIPTNITKKISETILVYPRLGEFRKITREIKLDKKIIDGIWQVKQLGLIGRTPKTDCDSSCPHYRLIKLPEDNLETAIPISLIYAKGWIDNEIDLDVSYVKRFIERKRISYIFKNVMRDIRSRQYVLKANVNDQFLLKKYLQQLKKSENDYLMHIAKITGLDIHIIKHPALDVSETEDVSMEKDMVNELESWKNLFGERKFKKIKMSAKSNATKIYSLPHSSKKFVTKSWNEWIK